MSESFLAGKVTLHGGDNRDVLKTLADNSIDSVVTDHPTVKPVDLRTK